MEIRTVQYCDIYTFGAPSLYQTISFLSLYTTHLLLITTFLLGLFQFQIRLRTVQNGYFIRHCHYWRRYGWAGGCFSSQRGPQHLRAGSRSKRSYSASAYYKPVELRQNLHVLTNSHVEKILFDKRDPPKAIGVQYSLEGALKEASAKKEVILAAGALQSPKILELSGVGEAELLQKHGINVVIDLPGVGQNLQGMWTAPVVISKPFDHFS